MAIRLEIAEKKLEILRRKSIEEFSKIYKGVGDTSNYLKISDEIIKQREHISYLKQFLGIEENIF